MTIDELKEAVAEGTVDTVLLAIADMEGRLQGKRITASYLLDESDAPHVPGTLATARDLFGGSAVAREAFGGEVVEHYLNHARVELEAFESAVTDWEKFRGFERQ